MPLHGRHRHSQSHLNLWIGLLFAVGATLFAVGGILSLAAAFAASWAPTSGDTNWVYFVGSIPFTTAAYLQLFQSANSSRGDGRSTPTARTIAWFGWYPEELGWLGCAHQFAGTLLFNLNTFDALTPNLTSLQQNVAIWAPDMIGSALFLASGYLAYTDYCHSPGAWAPHRLSWWITVVNLLGCIAFMISAVLAFVPPVASVTVLPVLSTAFTILGAAAFLVGALLMLPKPRHDN